MRIFIGWSGTMSRGVAGVLREKLPHLFQGIDPFLSSYDINKGAPWSEVLKEELSTASFGIVCVTRSNIKSAWLNFEAGALSKEFRLEPFLFLVNPQLLQGTPLAWAQSTVYEKDDILRLLSNINDKLDLKNRLNPDQLETVYENWWIELDAAIQDIALRLNDENETGYQWLYTVEDLRRTVTGLTSKCIMVVSTDPKSDFKLFFVREMIRRNLERGVSYAVLIAESESAGREVIEDAFSSHPDQLCLTPIPDKVFKPLAVTHCCLLNYKCDDLDLRVFVELPIKRQPNQIEQTYWIEVDEFAARGFAQRFRNLRDEYGRDRCSEKSASKRPLQPLQDGQDAAMM